MHKRFSKLAAVGAATLIAMSLSMAPANSAPPRPQPPAPTKGLQVQPPVKPGSVNAKSESAKGVTRSVQLDARGVPNQRQKNVGGSAVTFGEFHNYAWREFVYTPVTNTSTETKHVQVQLYVPSQNVYYDFFTQVLPGATTNPYFYGVAGNYYAYLYVLDGEQYVYDTYKGGANVTNVSVTVARSEVEGYVLATFTNNGNNYVVIDSKELLPYSNYGPYTGGPHYDYPAANGGSVSRYYQVDTAPYAIVADVDGSNANSFSFSGIF